MHFILTKDHNLSLFFKLYCEPKLLFLSKHAPHVKSLVHPDLLASPNFTEPMCLVKTPPSFPVAPFVVPIMRSVCVSAPVMPPSLLLAVRRGVSALPLYTPRSQGEKN